MYNLTAKIYYSYVYAYAIKWYGFQGYKYL